MKTSAIRSMFLAMVIFAPRAFAQQSGTADAAATAPAASAAGGKATAGISRRESDELTARTFMATKRYKEAASLYETLTKSYKNEPNYYNFAGIAYMQMGDLRAARKWFERCIKVEPRFADAYNNLGATWYMQKNFKRALQNYQRAVALQPGVAGYHTNVGFAYFSLKLPVEAEQAFRRALLMDPAIFRQNDRTGSVLQDRSVEDKGLFAFTMAKSYAGTGDAASCAAYLRRAIDEGYKELSHVYTDPGFAPVLGATEMQAVLSLIPAAGSVAAAPRAAP
jgi:tetratricopeptide (TPR) repeat protein